MKSINEHVELDGIAAFARQGFLAIPGALSSTEVARLVDVLDALTEDDPTRAYNTADILGLKDEFLDLIDLPRVLPIVQQLLGDNIWVNHSHFIVSPPLSGEPKNPISPNYGWHRDGGAINTDLPHPAPLLSIKIGFYLSDLSEEGRGQTYIINGSHKTGEESPENKRLPKEAIPLCIAPGTAVLYDRRVIHSIRSPNTSTITRKAIFIQYAYRWLGPVDAMTVEHIRDRCNAVRLQLLGLSAKYHTFDGAEGRSNSYYPTEHDIPVASSAISRMVSRSRSILVRSARQIRRRLR